QVMLGSKPDSEAVPWTRLHTSETRLPPVTQLVSEAPRDIARVLDRMLEKFPTNRYVSASAALDDLMQNNSFSTTVRKVPITGRSNFPIATPQLQAPTETAPEALPQSLKTSIRLSRRTPIQL